MGQNGLALREEIAATSKVVAEAKFGERVEILDRRRRFYRIRTSANQEGWVDGRALLAKDQMDGINRMMAVGGKLPPQAKATVYDALNLHTEPNRSSPSMGQIAANAAVEVIGHRVAPRIPFQAPALLPEAPKATPKKEKRKKKAASTVLPLPMPSPPPLPRNWRDLSHTRMAETRSGESVTEDKAKPAPSDDWNLVRTPDGKIGWALTRMLVMSIPDRVGRYAEGQRITSYFPIGEAAEEDGTKFAHYLWTTQKHPLEPYDFDGIRVFIYNVKRHRYETAFMDKQVKGFYPVELTETQVTENRKQLTVPGFRVLVEEEDGKFYKRTYSFQLYRVRLVDRQPWEQPLEPLQSAAGSGRIGEVPGEPRTISTEVKDTVKKLLGK